MTDVTIIPNEGGRPSLYREAMCGKVIEYMAQGKTDTQVCALLGISADSLSRYRRQYPEMAEAHAQGKMLQQAYWEEIAMKIATGEIRGGNATIMIFMMSNLFKQSYTQKNDNININIKNDNATLSDDELNDRLKQLKHLTEEL
jgi:hypothetical protein